MGYALGLPDALRRRGLTVEVVPGWENRSAGTFNPKGAVCHWTAGPRGTTKRPSLSIVTTGRADLPGPLCNVYGDRYGVAVVVAAGRANHAGAGGWRGLVGNSAVFGTEMEAAGPDDFTDAQRWAYPRINAAFCDLGGFGAEMVCGHSEWATPKGRKSDINNYPMSTMRAQVAALLAGGDDMPDNDTIKRLVWEVVTQPDVLDAIAGRVHSRPIVDKRGGWGLAERIAGTDANTVQINGALNAVRVEVLNAIRGGQVSAQQVVSLLLPALLDGLDDVQGQVSQEQLNMAVRSAFASLGNAPAA